MSDNEKALQIGTAFLEYQAAKTELAHVERKLGSVFSAYYKAGSTMEHAFGTIDPPKIVDGKLKLGYRAESIDAANLLNAEDLLRLVREFENAKTRAAKTQKTLVDLGGSAIL